MGCSPLGSSAHGISQGRTLEWIAISFSRGSSWLRDGTHVSCIGRWILYHWAWGCMYLITLLKFKNILSAETLLALSLKNKKNCGASVFYPVSECVRHKTVTCPSHLGVHCHQHIVTRGVPQTHVCTCTCVCTHTHTQTRWRSWMSDTLASGLRSAEQLGEFPSRLSLFSTCRNFHLIIRTCEFCM